MKKIFAVLTGIVLLTAPFAFSVSAAGNGSLSVDSAAAKPGESVTLDVAMPTNPGLVTMTIRVSYDTNVLELTNVTDPGLLPGAQLNPGYGSPYTICWIDGAATANNTKTGTIASFTFKVKESASEGVSAVSLQFVDSYDTDYQANQFSVNSGTVTVSKSDFSHSSSGTIEMLPAPSSPTEEQPAEITNPATEESAGNAPDTQPDVTVPNKQNTPSEPGSFPWWIILAAVIVVGGFGAFVVIKGKQR